MKQIRTRYAPSPTGYFHVGGARSALFNYLYAKHYNGRFILRIEDTDLDRSVEKGIESQYDNMLWLGIVPDESMFNPVPKYEPYIQSKKFELYKVIANELLDKKLAYRCFCTPEELEKNREESLTHHQTPKYNRHCLKLSDDEIKANLDAKKPFAIRLIIPDNHVYEWKDMVRGPISIPGSALTDFVILKSNNIGSYNFTNPIDDHDMQITHIIRGEEHVSNVPYQLAAIDALKQLDRYKDSIDDFNFVYGHLPVVINPNGKKLSKRDHSLKQFISDYKEMGFLPMAIVNFLANLGWSSPDNTEFFYDMQTLIKQFDGTRISTSPGMFDFKKMIAINKRHLERLSDEEYIKMVKPFIDSDVSVKITKTFINLDPESAFDKEVEILLLYRKELKYFSEINNYLNDLLNYSTRPISSENEQILIEAKNTSLFPTAIELANNVNDWNLDNINLWLKNISAKTGLKGKNLYMPLRICLFHEEHGPELTKLIHIFGKKYVIDKLSELK